MPAGFVQRLGSSAADFFFSGTYEAGGLKIGFLRIPMFAPANETMALQQLDSEIGFFRDNTDGLIIDEMRNPGGLIPYAEEVLRRMFPSRFRTLGYEVRATWSRIREFATALDQARSQGAEQWVISLYEEYLRELETAYRENRGRTGSLPLGGPSLDLEPAAVAYNKPILVLVDEFSASNGDMFAAVIQDNRRGLLFGSRTMGAGGSVFGDRLLGYPATIYSDGGARFTVSLMVRKDPIVTPDFPTVPYIEIGVRPDIDSDYMTRDNLLNRGRAFVEAFTAAMVEHIRKSR